MFHKMNPETKPLTDFAQLFRRECVRAYLATLKTRRPAARQIVRK